jgi:hypothetical protein
LQRQARDFAFVALFHLTERTVKKVLLDADKMHDGAVLKGKDPKDFNAMLGVLARCGYVTDGKPFAPNLQKLNLISNAIKHGQGPSLSRLASEFPDLILYRHPGKPLAPDQVFLTAELLRELAASVADFWGAFPMGDY